MRYSWFRKDIKSANFSDVSSSERQVILSRTKNSFSRKDTHFLFSVEKEDAILLAMIEECERINRHYRDHRQYFLNMLLVIAASLSSAPIPFSEDRFLFKAVAITASTFIFLMGFAGLAHLARTWRRMARMQYRSIMLQCKLIEDETCQHWAWSYATRKQVHKKCTDMDIVSIYDRSRVLAFDKSKISLRSIFRGGSTVWYLIPGLVIIYSICYFVVLVFLY